jgi:hypothetical protein
MKNGRFNSLTALATELERRAEAKRDYVADTRHVNAEVVGDAVKLNIGTFGQFDINDLAHRQIGEATNVPAVYYDKMRKEAPDLLAANVNRWFRQDAAKKTIRILDGNVRAVLSDRFNTGIEHEDMAARILPVLIKHDLDIMSADLTERRMYIKVVNKSVSRDLAKIGGAFGDGKHNILRTVSPALTISNSEVGMGAASILGGVYDGFCSNLATFGERSVRKYHVGGRQSVGEDVYALLTDETRRKTDEATLAQMADVVAAAFERARFDSLVDKIEGTASDRIEGDPVKAVSFASKKFGLTEGEGKDVLRHLIEGATLSRFGLYNAITRASQDVADYDRATELERLGGRIIELPDTEWKVIREAA